MGGSERLIRILAVSRMLLAALDEDISGDGNDVAVSDEFKAELLLLVLAAEDRLDARLGQHLFLVSRGLDWQWPLAQEVGDVTVAARTLESTSNPIGFDDDDRWHDCDPETLSKIGAPDRIDTNDVERVVVSASLQNRIEIAVDAARQAVSRREEVDETRSRLRRRPPLDDRVRAIGRGPIHVRTTFDRHSSSLAARRCSRVSAVRTAPRSPSSTRRRRQPQRFRNRY